MSLTREDVVRAARLARIAIDDHEADEVLEQLGRIFERFYRSPDVTIGGTGLG